MNAADLVSAHRHAFRAIIERCENAEEDDFEGELDTIRELAEEALALEAHV